MHLGRRDIRAWRQICDNRLSDPTALEESQMRVRETPFQIGNDAIVSSISAAKVVWILEIKLVIGSVLELISRVSPKKQKFQRDHCQPEKAAPLPSASIGCPWSKAGPVTERATACDLITSATDAWFSTAASGAAEVKADAQRRAKASSEDLMLGEKCALVEAR